MLEQHHPDIQPLTHEISTPTNQTTQCNKIPIHSIDEEFQFHSIAGCVVACTAFASLRFVGRMRGTQSRPESAYVSTSLIGCVGRSLYHSFFQGRELGKRLESEVRETHPLLYEVMCVGHTHLQKML